MVPSTSFSPPLDLPPRLADIDGQLQDHFRALQNGFQKLDKVKDSNKQSKQLEELTGKMRECKSYRNVSSTRILSDTYEDRELVVADPLHQGEVPVYRDIIYHILQVCMKEKNLAKCQQVHSLVIGSGLDSVTVFSDHLIRLFASCGKLKEAKLVFTKVSDPSVYTWHAIISAHVNFGEGEQALLLYKNMQEEGIEPDKVIISCILKACGRVGALMQGRLIHEQVVQSEYQEDMVVGTTLIDMYAKCGSLEEARDVFDDLPGRDTLMWRTMIAGYAEHGNGSAAFALFVSMQQEGIKPDRLLLSSILPSFGNAKAIMHGHLIHNHIISLGFGSDIAVANTLIDMYAKSGDLDKAHNVFNDLQNRDMVSWNAIIRAYAHHEHALSAIELLESMQQEGLNPNKSTFLCILKACSGANLLGPGRYTHDRIITMGLESDVMVGSTLIVMYAKNGIMKDAHKIFNGLLNKDTVSWNALIAGYVHQGHGLIALELVNKMKEEGITPNKVTYLSSVKACGIIGAIKEGKLVHEQIQRDQLESDMAIGNALIDMYAKCGSLEEAQKLFNEMPHKNKMSWAVMIAGYIQHGNNQSALDLFKRMQQSGTKSDVVACSYILRACSNMGAIDQGVLIHEEMIQNGIEVDVLIGTALVDLYGNAGRLEKARNVFEELQTRNSVLWHAMIASYAKYGYWHHALEIFKRMQDEGIEPDAIVYSCVLKACGIIRDLEHGKILHVEVTSSGLLSDEVIGNALVDMYLKCGSLEEAHGVFENLPTRNAVSWTALMMGYVQHGNCQAAFQLSHAMQDEGVQPDEVTFSCLLKACSISKGLEEGKAIHDQIVTHGFEADAVVQTALIDMYAKCGKVETARKMFDCSSDRDVGLWNAMISGYSEHGHDLSALQLFHNLQEEGIACDQITISSILRVCGRLGALEQGKCIHGQIISVGLQSDTLVGTSLVDMYAKCGSLHEACKIFGDLFNKDLVSWSAIIAGCAQHGNCQLALRCLYDMQKQGMMPNGAIFTSILAACARAGSIEEGQRLFKLMVEEYGILRCIEHFNCMIDLLGHVGYLMEAEELLEIMPMPPDIAGWMSLLAACRSHSRLELGRYCFTHVVRLDPGLATGFVLMSNIYADAHMWESVHRLEDLRKTMGVQKKPGKAWIEVNRTVHEFIVGDKFHQQRNDIHAKLKELRVRMEREGYMPQLDLVLKSIPDVDKEDALCGHCEKLALAFGLISTPEGTTLRISKNIRTCRDCHNACKIISKTERRQIVVSDIYRIHHFEDGLCSCGDLW